MKRIRYIMGICWAFLLGGLMACSSEEDPAGPTSDEGYRTLSIEIGAEGSLATKAYADDENAYEHEFMNELCVFVVDKNGKIEKKFLYSGETKNGKFTEEPEAGNAYEWRSGDFELPTGTKTIYAFANWSKFNNLNNPGWNGIISKVEGDELNDSELSVITITDPAGTINFDDGIYIPMSVKYGPFDFQVSQTARVELIRLVGRVDGTITNNRASEITVKSVTMRPFATTVPLMFTEDKYNAGVEANAVTYSFATPLELASGKSGTFRFYVNETANENPFAVEVLLGDDKRMTGALKNTKAIPRNHFLPLALNISDNDFDLYIMAYIAPIGGYPIQVMPNSPLDESEQTAGLYSATLPEGCSFQVFGSVVSGGDAGEKKACRLSLEVSDANSPVKIDDTDDTWAYVTSLSGQQKTLSVTFTDANKSPRTAGLSITTEPLKDLDKYGIQTNGLYLRQWQAAPAWYEVVPLRMANPE